MAKKQTEPAFLEQYRMVYPSESAFYVTSDNLVFLSSEKEKAEAHQAGLKGELRTF